MTVREKTQEIEKLILSPQATLSEKTKGRERMEKESDMRTCFQRDRDRIIHSKAFRRLKQKTQVFLSPEGDHYRTRLTHTLEVSQIARTIARALRWNEDLTEAIALGHDLGHTPFGHAGERVLNQLNPEGFKHFEQSVRVVEHLEKDHLGLNLTYEVLDGMLFHAAGEWAHTPEGRIIRFADRIAYINHDIEDAISAKVLVQEQLPKEATNCLGETKSQRIDTLITSLVENTVEDDLRMADDVYEQYNNLRAFMYSTVYTDPLAKAEESKVEKILVDMYLAFCETPEKMPIFYLDIAKSEGVDRAVTDYISGMSDDYAITLYEHMFVPKKWSI